MVLPLFDDGWAVAALSTAAPPAPAAAEEGAVDAFEVGGRGGLFSGERMEANATGCKAAATGTHAAGFGTEAVFIIPALAAGPRFGDWGEAVVGA